MDGYKGNVHLQRDEGMLDRVWTAAYQRAL